MNKIWKWAFVVLAVCCLSLTAMAQKSSVKKKSKPQPKKVNNSQSTNAGMTVEQIASLFLVPAGSPDTEIGWSSLDGLKDIIWDDRVPVKVFEKIYSRSGSIFQVAGRGFAFISFTGSETALSGVGITIGSDLDQSSTFGFKEFSKVLREQFGPKASIKLLRGKCPNEARGYSSAAYEVIPEGKKPMKVELVTQPQPTISPFIPKGTPSRSSSFYISRQKDENWKCKSN